MIEDMVGFHQLIHYCCEILRLFKMMMPANSLLSYLLYIF